MLYIFIPVCFWTGEGFKVLLIISHYVKKLIDSVNFFCNIIIYYSFTSHWICSFKSIVFILLVEIFSPYLEVIFSSSRIEICSGSSEPTTMTWSSENKNVLLSLVLETVIPFISSSFYYVTIWFIYMLNEVGITISSALEEMLEFNQPGWRQKSSNPITRLTFWEASYLSWGNFECLQVWNTTVGKILETWDGKIIRTEH